MIARRTDLEIAFDGVDISAAAGQYLESLSYTDAEDGEADDLSLTFADPEGLWLSNWLDAAVQGTATAGLDGKGTLTLSAAIVRRNWCSDGQDLRLDCGDFVLDSFQASGPGTRCKLGGTALGYGSTLRQTAKNKSWEAYTLSGIAGEIAGNGALRLTWDSGYDPAYDRVEQSEVSDLAFLTELCQDAGLNLKVADGQLIVYDQQAYEAQAAVMTLDRAGMTRWSFATGQSDTQYTACEVSYKDPRLPDGHIVEGRYTDPEAGDKAQRVLRVRAQVADAGAATALAQRLLRLKNKFEYQGSITLPGDPRLAAGLCVQLTGVGAFCGKWLIRSAVHSVSSGGYTTKIDVRKCLEGY